jgi:adenylate cyclase
VPSGGSAPIQPGPGAPPVGERPTAAGTSLAVLPFLDLSPGRDQRYFCDGIAEELANALGRVPGLRIAARTSAFAFRDAAVDAPEIARRLGVDSLVEGSVRRAGDQLRVTAKLVDSGGFQSWAGTWNRALADVFAIQEEIARQVVDALQSRLAGPGTVTIRPVRGTSIEAYDLYLRGLGFLHKFGRRSQRFALRMFADAIELDPRYAPAWAGVALSHLLLYIYSEASEENRRGVIEAAERAVLLDPLSAEAHVAAANAAMLSGDAAAADAGFRRAQELDPSLFQAWYYHARSCASRGDHERAVQLYERAAAVRPEDYDALSLAAQCYTSLGRPDDARRAYQRSFANAERALQLQPNDVRVIALCASSLIALEPDEARRWIERALALEPDEPYVHYCAACTFGMLGDVDRALDSLERVGLEKMANASWMDHDSSLDPLRGHPRFEALRSRAR